MVTMLLWAQSNRLMWKTDALCISLWKLLPYEPGMFLIQRYGAKVTITPENNTKLAPQVLTSNMLCIYEELALGRQLGKKEPGPTRKQETLSMSMEQKATVP